MLRCASLGVGGLGPDGRHDAKLQVTYGQKKTDSWPKTVMKEVRNGAKWRSQDTRWKTKRERWTRQKIRHFMPDR